MLPLASRNCIHRLLARLIVAIRPGGTGVSPVRIGAKRLEPQFTSQHAILSSEWRTSRADASKMAEVDTADPPHAVVRLAATHSHTAVDPETEHGLIH